VAREIGNQQENVTGPGDRTTAGRPIRSTKFDAAWRVPRLVIPTREASWNIHRDIGNRSGGE
jgi:hypothetical protein